MIDLKKLQKDVYQNKVDKKFNISDIAKDFCLAHEELSEAYRAYYRKLPDLGEELADVLIYLLGIAEMTSVDLEKELVLKIEKNKKRVYQQINGINVRTKE
ncbi:MAG: MazG nucleotide pyrophosphohydrolase domain-containing protein [Patescibacteria group bacterium]|nr:MazG nucleotide pyrophosphohydrolase domain-containing protein [Patescibacteria group bacterium]